MKKLNYQKGISPIIAVILLAVILIGGGAYYFKQQAQPTSKPVAVDATANWKTYENKEGKFSIKIPLEWRVTERKGNGNSNSKEVSLEGKEGNVALDWGSGFGGMCDPNPETLQLSDRTVETCQHDINNDTESWSFSIGEGKVNNIGYSNNAVANKPSPLNHDTILKILSTLKFTDTTANWKTYTKDEYGFEIKYDPSWLKGDVDGPDYTKFQILSWNFFNNDKLYEQLKQTSGQKNCTPSLSFIIYKPEHKFDESFLGKSVETKEIEGVPMKIYEHVENNCGYTYTGIIKLKNGNIFAVELGLITDKKAIISIFDQILSTFKFTNPVADYFDGSEIQAETDAQRQNIAMALNDILNLSENQLKEKRYQDYSGNANQWDLPTLIYRHFVPDAQKTLGDNFFRDVKEKDAQDQVKKILSTLKFTP